MASRESKAFVAAKERVLILLLCVTAALRVFILSAAFPFFSNIDEDLHFDLITQYSHAQVPRSFDRLKEETLNWIVPYASPEFMFPPEQFPNGKFPVPLWKEPWSKVEPEIASTRAAWSSEINFESSQPPLYYALVSAWWWLGKYFGLAGVQSLYWIRFLNVSLIAMMVWLRVRNCPHDCAGTDGSAHRRAAVAGFHSSECVLRNEQRRALAALLRHLVSLRFAMVANERAKLFAGSAYRCRGCSYVSDEALQLAVSRSRACGDRREIRCDQFTNTSRRADRASRTDFVRCNSGRHLDALDKISFWRSHRIDSENWFARVDAKTVRRLVAASDFHATRCLDFLVGFNRELLARGSYLAWSAVALARSGWILRGHVITSCCRG